MECSNTGQHVSVHIHGPVSTHNFHAGHGSIHHSTSQSSNTEGKKKTIDALHILALSGGSWASKMGVLQIPDYIMKVNQYTLFLYTTTSPIIGL